MTEPIQFDKAEFEAGANAATCVACGNVVGDVYFAANGKVCCPSCQQKISAPPLPAGAARRVLKATLIGAVGGLAGAAVWWGIYELWEWELGLVAILVGFLVGGGVRMGAEGVGGRGYQLLAVLLTYLAVAAAHACILFRSPETREEDMPFVLHAILAMLFGLVAPFLGGILGAIIVAIALWEAWRMNGRPKIEWTGPHRVARAEPAPAPLVPAPPPPLPPSV